MIIIKLCGVCILTDNIPRLVEFYKKVLSEEPNGDDIHSSFEKAQFAIWNPGNVNASKDKSMSLMFFVDDADEEYDRLFEANLNIEFISEPTIKPWGVKSFCFKDPDGNKINFLTPIKE